MALNETSPDLAKNFAAVARIRSWLRRVSARRGFTDPVFIVPPVHRSRSPVNVTEEPAEPGVTLGVGTDIAERIAFR
ncbi:hypothetical protein GCM10027598_78330 [Amycolatopsis oliviviridis]